MTRLETTMPDARYRIDCGKTPNDIGCTLIIEGPQDDVLDAAVEHARSKHGHSEPPEALREAIRRDLERV
jgi:predicted small metal-binding protein